MIIMPFKAFVFVYATNAQRDAGVHALIICFVQNCIRRIVYFLCVIYCMYLVFSVVTVTVQKSWCHF